MSRGKSVGDVWKKGGFASRVKNLKSYNVTIQATISGEDNRLIFEVASFQIDPSPSPETQEQIENFIYSLDEEI